LLHALLVLIRSLLGGAVVESGFPLIETGVAQITYRFRIITSVAGRIIGRSFDTATGPRTRKGDCIGAGGKTHGECSNEQEGQEARNFSKTHCYAPFFIEHSIPSIYLKMLIDESMGNELRS
jgi:hypothetical protein